MHGRNTLRRAACSVPAMAKLHASNARRARLSRDESYLGGAAGACFSTMALRAVAPGAVRARVAAPPPLLAAQQRASSSSASEKRRSRAFLRRNMAPLSPKTPQASQQTYSPFTLALVKGVGRMLGYNFVKSKAIQVTGDLYDRCAARPQEEAHFWYKGAFRPLPAPAHVAECALPGSFQTWFQLTNMHVFLLMSRFRALPREEARTYAQELINHFFIDTESRMRERFGVQTARLVKGYMRDLHVQHRGAMLAYDEGLATDDVRLSGAVWRNVWGGGWGAVAGVKRKTPLDRTRRGEDPSEEGAPELVLDQAVASASEAGELGLDRAARAELMFPQHLERVTRWLRREVYRLGNLPDQAVLDGDVHATRGTPEDGDRPPPVVSAYTRI